MTVAVPEPVGTVAAVAATGTAGVTGNSLSLSFFSLLLYGACRSLQDFEVPSTST